VDAATVFKLLSLIPDRSAAALGGSTSSSAAACKHPERLAFLAQRAHWLAPLDSISKEEQRMLGLMAAHGRPAQEAGEEPLEAEDLDLEADLAAEESFAPAAPREEEPASVAAL